MRVLADYHHEDLFYSLQLLFEKRLDWELYRPIGLEWYTEGYWNIYPHPDTARQFLATDQATNRPNNIFAQPLQDTHLLNKSYVIEDGIYYVTPNKGMLQRGITLEKFRNTRFDILVSSIPSHIDPFNRLIAQYQPHAKHIFQIGNAWTNIQGVGNLLSSTTPFQVSAGINSCFYHQEFDTTLFHYIPPTNHTTINSYIHYMQRKDLMDVYATHLPEMHFTAYGAGMDSCLSKLDALATAMTNSSFTWHYKPEGDGFGHIIHNTYACGRPAIIAGNFYDGKIASALLEHNKTCIDLSKLNTADCIKLIRQNALPDRHARMCEEAYKRFSDVVNFDYEFEWQIKPFLDRLI